MTFPAWLWIQCPYLPSQQMFFIHCTSHHGLYPNPASSHFKFFPYCEFFPLSLSDFSPIPVSWSPCEALGSEAVGQAGFGMSFCLQSSQGSCPCVRALFKQWPCAFLLLLHLQPPGAEGRQGDPPSLLSEHWQPVQDILGSAFLVLGDGQITPQLPAVPPKS